MVRLLHYLIACLAVLSLTAPTYAQSSTSPSDTFLAYHAALKRSFNERAILPFYTSSARRDFESRYSGEMRTRVFFMMKSAAPQNVEIKSVQIEGDRAVLTLAANDPGNDTTAGTATLAREHGEWRIVDVVWLAAPR